MKLPNILFVVIDCARSDKWLGTGRTTITPNLDRLCHEGISFPTVIAEKSFTLPAFSSLLTGLYSPRHGVHMAWGYRLPEQLPVLTHILGERGYTTYAEVTGPMIPEMGLQRAFDRYVYRAPCDYLHTAWGKQFVQCLQNGCYREPWFLLLHLFELHKERHVSAGHNRPESGCDRYERAVSSLDSELGRVFSAAGDNCLIVVTGDHGEKTKSEVFKEGTAVSYASKLLDLEKARGMPLYQLAFWAGPSLLQNIYMDLLVLMPEIKLEDAKKKLHFGKWISLCDKFRLLRLAPRIRLFDLFSIGKPLKQTSLLQKCGLLDEGQSQRRLKQFAKRIGKEKLHEMGLRMWINSFRNNLSEGHGMHVYDYLVRVPLVMQWHGQLPAGIVFRRMVRQPDIMPTILDIIRMDWRRMGNIDGQSFFPLIEGKSWHPLPAYLSVSGCPPELELRGIRTEEYKYIFGAKNSALPEELYDLQRDPFEKQNSAKKKPELCESLRKIANRFIPGEGEAESKPVTFNPEQQRKITKYLRGLGYID